MADTQQMPLYQGTKTLYATPMTRGDYNAYRGWQVPANEDPADAGYLVEYTDGGKANDPRHVGYISWSPADVFERSYMPCGSHEERMLIELRELEGRLNKLTAFVGTLAYGDLSITQRNLLVAQRDAMQTYSTILKSRLSQATIDAPGA